MSLLRARPVERRDGSWQIPPRGYANVGPSGVSNPAQAMRHGAVWASVNYIADTISTLPLHRFTTGVDGSAVKQSGVTIIEDPSAESDPITVSRDLMVSWLTEGNLFALPTSFDNVMRPRKIKVLDPGKMRMRRPNGPDGSFVWQYEGTDVPEVIHRPAYTMPGCPIGLSPLQAAARAVGLGLSAEEFGLRWFVDGAVPSALLTSEKELTQEQATTAKARWVAAVSGRREPAVMGGDWKYESVSVPANESQFLETTQANVADVTRYFGLRAEDIGGSSGDSMTYANVEQRGLDRLTYPINPWVIRLEAFWNAITPRPQYVKYNLDALIRVDLLSRYQAHDLAIRAGWKSPNEARDHENLAPIPNGEGDVYLWPPYSTAPAPAPIGAKP